MLVSLKNLSFSNTFSCNFSSENLNKILEKNDFALTNNNLSGCLNCYSQNLNLLWNQYKMHIRQQKTGLPRMVLIQNPFQ